MISGFCELKEYIAQEKLTHVIMKLDDLTWSHREAPTASFFINPHFARYRDNSNALTDLLVLKNEVGVRLGPQLPHSHASARVKGHNLAFITLYLVSLGGSLTFDHCVGDGTCRARWNAGYENDRKEPQASATELTVTSLNHLLLFAKTIYTSV